LKREEIGRRYPILDFRVFGSRASGDDSPYSDIDVMIEVPELSPSIESEIYDLVFDINLKAVGIFTKTVAKRWKIVYE
jgi:predicted nucleotidyltransferase